MFFKSSISKINILYISPFPHLGGGEISLLTLLKNLDRERFKSSLICYSEGPFIEKVKELGIEVIVFERGSFLSNFLIVWRIFRYIKKNNIHLIHINCLDIRAGIAAWLARVPFIGHLRVIFPFTWRDRLFVRLSQKVIAVSNAVVNAFCQDYPECKDKFIVIPNAVEIPVDISAAKIREEFNLSPDVRLVGAVGRIDPCKGYEYFIEAAMLIKERFENVYFFIVGDVSQGDKEGRKYLDMLERQVDELGLKDYFFFMGFREDVLNVIKELDVLVVPSVVLKKNGGEVTEGFGRVAIEAMALGVPVVASNIGGLKETIEDGISGILVPPSNFEAIAEVVLSILIDKIKAITMGKAGRKRVEGLFTIEKHVANIETIYKTLMSSRRT